MKHIILVSLSLGLTITGACAAQGLPSSPVPIAIQQGYPAPTTLISPFQPVLNPSPASLLLDRPIRDPSGLVTIRPPQYPPGVYRQPANTCFVGNWQYPEADIDGDGRLDWGELSQFCRNQRR